MPKVVRYLSLVVLLVAGAAGLAACGAGAEPTGAATQAAQATAAPAVTTEAVQPRAAPTPVMTEAAEPTIAPAAAATEAAEPTAAAAPTAGAEEPAFPPQMPSSLRGQVTYEAYCAECHGTAGDGSGLAGAANFTDVEFMRAEKPAEFYESISEGRPGTAMPAWKGTLSEMEIWDVLYYEWSFGTSAEEIAEGRALFTANCVECHGQAGDGSGLAGAANFTDQAFMSAEKPEEFHEAITEGKEGTAMPAWGDTLTEDQIWALVQYVWTFAYVHPAH